jgi:hypothetical protein
MGCRSVGELLMALSTSLVAVCCSRASFFSLNSLMFSMVIAAWSAKVLTRLICRYHR